MQIVLVVLAWLAGICLVAVVALAIIAWQMLGSMCGNEVLAEVHSPDGEHKVVVFQRDCGATTGFSTQASLISSRQELDNDSGNIFVADTNHRAAPAGPGGGPSVSIRWLGSDALEVSHHPGARIFFASPEESGVRISYRATGIVASSAGEDPSRATCYTTCVVSLIGTVEFLERPGPPGFGETPNEDVRIRVPTLKLDVPVTVEESDYYVPAVSERLLQFRWDGDELRKGRRVEVVGTLRGSQTAAEFTPVVVEVESYRYLGD